MSSAEGRRAGGMWLKGLDISSDFLGYTVSGDNHIGEVVGFNGAGGRQEEWEGQQARGCSAAGAVLAEGGARVVCLVVGNGEARAGV